MRVYGLRSLLTRLGQAHWFYEDFCRAGPEGENLKSLTLREFAGLIFAQHPSLDRHKARVLWKQACYAYPPAEPYGRHLQEVHGVQGVLAALAYKRSQACLCFDSTTLTSSASFCSTPPWRSALW